MRFTSPSILLLLSCLLSGSSAYAQSKPAELLLIGSFHFHNPGADVAKMADVDVLTPKAQADLETITSQIAAFGPQKVFVEWEQKGQAELDELYARYRSGQYESYIRGRYTKPSTLNFYLKNEIIQLAFRTAKKANLPRVYGLDYVNTSFPYDSVRQSIKVAGQTALQQNLDAIFRAFEADFARKAQTFTLRQLLLDFNTPASLTANKGMYLEVFNRAGAVDNFVGAFLVSEWYRRNLYMYAILQKTVAPTDERVMVLVGAGHAAMLRDFVPYDQRFRLKEVHEVIR
ncbi:DUF5694 domain-containing protein [Hymenobacter lapidiphilus]|uniref:TraB/GumN family protein n=1 Tax=Hymenobacter lapidiphilus TaxID=2608003 RepID=A0A7Y7PP44_9BACT|nr:DUF5694 domain-containing protein [Hymenobacter lapidiphilus]NVO31325.1 hypothetical protein [Hymenobacter lapidiphilus]